MGYSQTIGDTFIDNDLLYEITSLTPNTVEIRSSPAVVGMGIVIPDTANNNNITYSVTGIQENAFLGKGYTSITIPNSIISIGSGAFFSNPLTCVVSEAIAPPTLTTSPTDPFGPVRSNIDLSIPSGTASAYASAQWTGFNSITEGLSNTFISDNITYQITSTINNTVEVVNYNTSGGLTVNIPATVSSACTSYTVTRIDNFALQNMNLTSVTLPNTLIEIGGGAFAFNDLPSITIPNSVITIEDGAFAQNNNMTDVVIGNNVTSIGGFAFRFNGLNSVTIPDSVTNIGSLAFSSNSISSVIIGNGLTVLNENVFSYNNITSVNIPNSVTSIADSAFLQNNLTSIVIPDNVTSIGELAFGGNDLTDVVIGNSVTNIDANAFNTNQLTSITIPASVTTIGDSAFFNNPLLTDVISLATTPPTITSGGIDDSFNSDRSTINLVIPNSTTDVYSTNNGALWSGFKMVFEEITANTLRITDYNSASGTNVNIPAIITGNSTVYDVTEIGNSAFTNKGLTSVIIPDSVITIGSQAFVTNDLTTLVLGNNVANIELGAFVDNDLTDITIPASVTNIGSLAFAANPLTDVTSLAITPAIITTGTNDTFDLNGDRSNIHLHIPAGTLGAYVTDPGALWTGFNPVTEDALSIDEFELAKAVKVITTTDAIKIVTNHSLQLQDYSMYSISGVEISRGKESYISTNAFASGIYILKLNFDKGIVTKKVIIK